MSTECEGRVLGCDRLDRRERSLRLELSSAPREPEFWRDLPPEFSRDSPELLRDLGAERPETARSAEAIGLRPRCLWMERSARAVSSTSSEQPKKPGHSTVSMSKGQSGSP